MLWRKAWRESRARFLICAGVVAGICIVGILFEDTARRQWGLTLTPNTYVGYIYKLTYGGMVRGLFSLLVGVLGLGGLQRERALGTAGFTLVLPVSRLRLIITRACVGIGEIAILSLLPAAILQLLSPVVHETYPASQALQFSLLWFVFGVSGFASWLLASVIFASEFTALTVCFGVGFLTGAATQVGPLRPYNLSSNYLMSGHGMRYFDSQTAALIGPLPWASMFVYTLLALVLVILSVRITKHRDFP